MTHFEASSMAGLAVFYSVFFSSSLSGEYTNKYVPCERPLVRPAKFSEHNSNTVRDISTKPPTLIKQED